MCFAHALQCLWVCTVAGWRFCYFQHAILTGGWVVAFPSADRLIKFCSAPRYSSHDWEPVYALQQCGRADVQAPASLLLWCLFECVEAKQGFKTIALALTFFLSFFLSTTQVLERNKRLSCCPSCGERRKWWNESLNFTLKRKHKTTQH